MVAPVHNFDPKILLEGSAKLRWVGRGQVTSHFIASSVCMWSNGKKRAFDVGGPSSIDFIYFWGSNEKQRSCVGRGGGAQRPVCVAMSSKRRARTRGQNPLVLNNNIPASLVWGCFFHILFWVPHGGTSSFQTGYCRCFTFESSWLSGLLSF